MVLTSGRTTRPSCVLFDADVVIAAHVLGIWRWLVRNYRVLVPSVVVHEALFFRTRAGERVDINLPALVKTGEIEELAAGVEEIAKVYSYFDAWFADTIHAGETEGLALVLTDRATGAMYCCGDARAIQALAMLGLGDCGVSLESLLGGKKPRGRLELQFTEGYFRRNLDIGRENRITGTGLVKGLLD